MSQGDMVSDILARLIERLGHDACPPDLIRSLEADIRRDWGGDKVYITSGSKKLRDGNIRADYQRGLSMERLAMRYKVGIRRVRQILMVRDG